MRHADDGVQCAGLAIEPSSEPRKNGVMCVTGLVTHITPLPLQPAEPAGPADKAEPHRSPDQASRTTGTIIGLRRSRVAT